MSTAYTLSFAALKDLEGITEYTREMWGKPQATKYAQQLESKMQ